MLCEFSHWDLRHFVPILLVHERSAFHNQNNQKKVAQDVACHPFRWFLTELTQFDLPHFKKRSRKAVDFQHMLLKTARKSDERGTSLGVWLSRVLTELVRNVDKGQMGVVLLGLVYVVVLLMVCQ